MEVTLAPSACIASLGRLWSAGSRLGRYLRSVLMAASMYTTKSTGDRESSYGVPTVELKEADRTFSVPRNEHKTSTSFDTEYFYHVLDSLAFAASYRCPHTISDVLTPYLNVRVEICFGWPQEGRRSGAMC